MKELPEWWEWKQLSDVAEITSGDGAPQGDKYFGKEGSPFIRAGSLKSLLSGAGEDTLEHINDVVAKQYKMKLFPKGSVIFAKSGMSATKNRVYTLQNDCYVVNHLAILMQNASICDSQFLMHRLSNYKPARLIRDPAYPSIRLSDIGKVKLAFPPLPTQHRIVAILEKAEQLKTWHTEQGQLLDDYLKSVFLEMFGDPGTNPMGWDVKTIDELSAEVIDCPHSTPKYVEKVTDYPCIRTSELKNGYIHWPSMKYLDGEQYTERIKRLKPEAGDIVYGREGTFGEAIVIPPNTNMSLGQRVMLFRPNELCNSHFLWALVRSDYLYRQAVRKTSGSTVGHVNVKDIKKFKGICPPITLQNKFADIVQQTEKVKAQHQESATQADDLFNALMQKAFTGELVA